MVCLRILLLVTAMMLLEVSAEPRRRWSPFNIAKEVRRLEAKLKNMTSKYIKLQAKLKAMDKTMKQLMNTTQSHAANSTNTQLTRPPSATPAAIKLTETPKPTQKPAATPTSKPTPTPCGRGYLRLAAGLCVSRVSLVALPRPDAAEVCRRGGGRLLQLENTRKFLLVTRLLADDRQIWVGASFQDREGDFFWNSDGARLQVKVAGLAGRGASCAVLVRFRTPGYITALDCRLPRYFVCEQAD